MREHLSMILLVVVCTLVIGEVVAFAILLPVAGEVSAQSKNGQKARSVQCALAPISIRLYVDARDRGVLPQRDLDRINQALVQACPRVAPPK